MYTNKHLSNDNRNLFILLTKRNGKRKASIGVEEKDCVVSQGTLLEIQSEAATADPSYHSHSPGKFIFRSFDVSDVYLTCLLNEVDSLDTSVFELLYPIHSLKDRLQVFKDKHLLNDGRLLQIGDSVFVRLKDLQSQTEIEGIIHYKGPIEETVVGVYFGVELKEGRGFSDGVHNNRRFFRTPPNHAVFVPLNRIRRNRDDWHKDDLMRAGDMQTRESSQLQVQMEEPEPITMSKYRDLQIGDRIAWPTDNELEWGTVRWIGVLPGESRSNVTIGVEFDNPVGTGTGKYKEKRLFYTQQGHASLIPPLGLIKEEDIRPRYPNPIFSEQEKMLNDCRRQNKSLSQQQDNNRKSKADVNKSSLPSQFNHHTGYLEPLAVNGASSHPMNGQGHYQGGYQQGLSNGLHPDPGLTVGCMVEVQTKTPFHGVIRWIGLADSGQTKLTAGLELENEHPVGTDGVFKNIRFFHCKPGRALFVPLNKCVRDKRFSSLSDTASASFGTVSEGGGGIESPDVPGDIPVPEIMTPSDLDLICGKNRGIQGHHNSCYLDSTLFSMFYFSTVFDSIFNRPPKPNDLQEYAEVQRVLKDGIVNPLRKHNYVASNNVWKLRKLLDRLGTVPGMMGEEKDVEEFLSALLSQIMKADPLLHLSTGEHTYFYQLFMEKDENLLLPTTQKLVELSFLQGNVKLKKVPACLMIQMPRFGKDYKMFRRIVPSLQLDITDILENSPRECIVCGDLATWECKKCYQIHGMGLNTTAFCEKCRIKSHQHVNRKNHQQESISTEAYLAHFQKLRAANLDNGHIISLPREKMELFAVICIQTSHYVSFVKCGPGIDAPWVFFDSMADRIGEQGGYNVPEVTLVPEMASWLSENNFNFLNKDEDRELPEHLRRLLCDGYMCMYQSPDVMMFQ